MMRDRIVSGLSLAVLVVEAAAKSGTMDTAERARKQGRAVLAIDWPGDDERVAGNRRLLRSGALPIPADGHPDWRELLQQCDRIAEQLASGHQARQPKLF
jgi:predicted Rossmann fold nucleotide-binding protein DprA/Smf involved in DNA uptake